MDIPLATCDSALAGAALCGAVPQALWMWVDLQRPAVRQRIDRQGCFVSAAGHDDLRPTLPFMANPRFGGELSPFALGVMQEYTVEHRLEHMRMHEFAEHPSRMSALVMLRSEADAHRYAQYHPAQTAARALLAVQSHGRYRLSLHDSRWIDLLRAGAVEAAWQAERARRYWRGEPAEEAGPDEPLFEVLYLGRVDFV